MNDRTTMRHERSVPWLPDVDQALVSVGGFLGVGALYLGLRSSITLGPVWLLLVIEGALLAPFIVMTLLLRRPLPHALARGLALALLAVLGVALIYSVIRFVQILPTYTSGAALLRDGALLYAMNVLVFGATYWELDGGGPARRAQSGHQAADYLFPQQLRENPTVWAPNFVDYLFLAFCFSTALSPADTAPLSRLAKILMMAQAVISLTILVLLLGRAVNILGPATPATTPAASPTP